MVRSFLKMVLMVVLQLLLYSANDDGSVGVGADDPDVVTYYRMYHSSKECRVLGRSSGPGGQGSTAGRGNAPWGQGT